jgi:hypothetical protein
MDNTQPPGQYSYLDEGISIICREGSAPLDAYLAAMRPIGISGEILCLRRSHGACAEQSSFSETVGNDTGWAVRWICLPGDPGPQIYPFVGGLARYRRVLFWLVDDPICEDDLRRLLNAFSPDRAVGLWGGRLNEEIDLSASSWLTPCHLEKVDYLDGRAIMFDRSLTTLRGLAALTEDDGYSGLSQALLDAGVELCAVPHSGRYRVDAPSWTPADYYWFVQTRLNPGFRCRTWAELNYELMPTILPGTHFQRLLNDGHSHSIIVTGCQRSGTTLMYQLLGQTLRGTLALSEIQSCEYLLGELKLPRPRSHLLALQATFMVSERESFLSLPEGHLIVFLLRNPLSVCWSLLYHFGALDLIWHSRGPHVSHAIRSQFGNPPSLIASAAMMYLDSLDTAKAIMTNRPGSSIVVDYDALVEDYRDTIEQISFKFNDLCPGTHTVLQETCDADIRREPMNNRNDLSHQEEQFILDACNDEYLMLRKMAGYNR